MPPPFSSTSLGTFVKKVLRSATHVQSMAPRLPAGAAQNHLQRLRAGLQRAVQETFPALNTPPHQLNQYLRAQPIYLTSSRPTGRLPTAAALRGASRGFRTGGGYRPNTSTLRGPAVPANVGLGSARTFASGPAAGAVNGKIPMGFRALASLLDDEEFSKTLPRPTRFSPYVREKRNRRHLRRSIRCLSTVSTSRESLFGDLQHYFPKPLRPVEVTSIVLPPLPESLITVDQVTTLSIPLSPSLQTLLLPTPRIPYSEAEIGISVLARLTQGLYPLQEAFSTYASTRILPLLAKLDGLGLLAQDSNLEFQGEISLDVVLDEEGSPDILRIIFSDRSISDIKQLLGESLRSDEEGEWWALSQRAKIDKGLSLEERKDLMEVWDSPHQVLTGLSNLSTVDNLIFPTVDVNLPAIGSPAILFDVNEEDFALTPETVYSWPDEDNINSTGLSTLNPSPTSNISHQLSAEALSASLVSHLYDSASDSSSEAGGGSELWEEVRPTDEDSDVESSCSSIEIDGWLREEREGEDLVLSAAMLGSRWAGSGEGFGFVQAW